jgi:trigger factor
LSDAELQETVANLQKRFGDSTQPDITAEGDYIYGDIKQVEGELTKEKTFISLEEVKKEALPQFVGKAKGDSITFAIQDTFNSADAIAHVTGVTKEEAESLTGNFEFTITEIERTSPATMGQEFFDKILGKDAVQAEEEFLNKLREILQSNYKQESERAIVQQIQKQLVDNTEIILPDDFLKRWLMAANEKVTPEVIEKEYDLYVRDLKWNLIKNKVADDNNIKVEHEEVLAKTKDLIRQQFGSMGMGEVSDEEMNGYANNFLKADKGKNYMNIFDQAFTDRIVDFIKSQASVTSKAVSVEEYKNIRNEENQ